VGYSHPASGYILLTLPLRQLGESHNAEVRFTAALYRNVVRFNLLFIFEFLKDPNEDIYRGADKSLARPGKKQATATEDFEFHISYL